MGEQLYWHAWGVDLSPVTGNFTKDEQKGYGHGMTLLRDYEKSEIYACLLDLCEEACRRARRDEKEGAPYIWGSAIQLKQEADSVARFHGMSPAMKP